MHTYKEAHFKDLGHTVLGPGKATIYRIGQQARNSLGLDPQVLRQDFFSGKPLFLLLRPFK